jgi:predicted transcriptional regulator
MFPKEKIKKAIDSMPDDVSLDEVIDKIILLAKIEQGLIDAREGKVFTTEEVKSKLNKWLE